MDVRNCAEVLQRHGCWNVCHKYGHVNDCHFQFPHDYVENSFFDEKTNSVVMKCLDGNVNYYNCHLLTSTRHNHDIKNILSGKSAKAAMFYITDYITKSDEKTHQVLALLSQAVAVAPPLTDDISPKQHACTLLLRCLTAMIRNQKIHGQQAARYLRNIQDGIKSHETKPMMSRSIVGYLTKLYHDSRVPPHSTTLSVTVHNQSHERGILPNLLPQCRLNEKKSTISHVDNACMDETNPCNDEDDGKSDVDGESDEESEYIGLLHSQDGSFYQCSQVDDYIHQDDSLSDLSFYEFIRRFHKEKKFGKFKEEVGWYQRFFFTNKHPEYRTHMLVEVIGKYAL